MTTKKSSKNNWIITGLVLVLGIFIVLFAFLPFLELSDFTKGLVLGLAIFCGGYPLIKYFLEHKKSREEKEDEKIN